MRSLALFALLGVTLGSAPATGAVVAFACESSTPCTPGVQYEFPKGSAAEPVHLFVEFGATTSGTACVLGATGKETCGFDVNVAIQGDPFITNFIPASVVTVKFAPQTFGPTSRALRAVGVMAVNPGTGPQYVGQLVLNTTEPDGGTVIITGSAVRADLESFTISQTDVAQTTGLPEPDSTLVLILGMIALCGLQTLRTRRVRVPAQH